MNGYSGPPGKISAPGIAQPNMLTGVKVPTGGTSGVTVWYAEVVTTQAVEVEVVPAELVTVKEISMTEPGVPELVSTAPCMVDVMLAAVAEAMA